MGPIVAETRSAAIQDREDGGSSGYRRVPGSRRKRNVRETCPWPCTYREFGIRRGGLNFSY